MSPKDSNKPDKRLRNSYFTSVMSISLVLFIIGILGLLLLSAQKLSDYIKENMSFTLYLTDSIKEIDALKLEKKLSTASYIRQIKYVSKEEGAKILSKELGEDFIDFIGYNPLPIAIDIKLKTEYTNSDSLKIIENQLKKNEEISDINYPKSLINLINENVKKIGLILLGFSFILLIIALSLINNTVRLSIYSKRFLINTMLLVGATRRFIRKPFLVRSILHGIYAGIIAIILLYGLIYYAHNQMPDISFFYKIDILGALFILVMLLGILISWVSTYFAVNKFLNLNTDDLYYYH